MIDTVMNYPFFREHDKGPEEFCSVLLKLVDAQLLFNVSILGSHSNDIPSMSLSVLDQVSEH